MPKRSIILCLIILTMNGCQSTPQSAEVENKFPRDRGAVTSPSLSIEQYSSSQYKAVTLVLNNAAAQINAAQSLAALNLLKSLNPDTLPTPLSDQYQRLSGMAYGQLGDQAQALVLMNLVSNPNRQDLEVIIEFCDGLEDYSCSARNLIRLQQEHSARAEVPANKQDLQDAIWSALMLANSPDKQFSSQLERGWWSLRDSIFNSGSVDRAKLSLAQWASLNPNHSAAQRLPSMLKNLQRYSAPKVALLLPLTGRLSNAGDAIRDGFLGGYFADSRLYPQPNTQSDAPPNTQFETLNRFFQPEDDVLERDFSQVPSSLAGAQAARSRSLTLYDSASAPLSDLVARAKAEGADLIIGPLRKDKAQTVAELAARANMPALLLNYLEQAPETQDSPSALTQRSEIYQLGAAIENEAATLANALMNSEHQRVLVVHSGQTWSQRALAEFQALWPYPVSVAKFDQIKEVTGAVGGSMGVADSVARKNELTQLFDQEIQFLPRARQDLDAVVALTSNVESRALVPALRFHFADNLPVYATSQSIRGGGNIKELAGFTVTELPILTSPNLNMSNLVSTYGLKESPLVELYALGYDAYQLATWIHLLNQPGQTPLNGSFRLSMATGAVQLNPNGRFQRTLELVNIDRRGRLKITNERL